MVATTIYSSNQTIAYAATEEQNKSVIYYFHGNFRCATCTKIETLARNVFDQNFKDNLEFKVVNVEELENRHFIQDYQLVSKALVLVKNKDGKQVDYKNLQAMWNYIRDEQSFNKWLTEEISNFLLK